MLLLSSLHESDAIDKNTREKLKPEIITTYNETKGGVDMVDKLCALYNCARNTRRWPMVAFFSIMSVAGINSQVIYDGNVGESKFLARQKFLKTLSFELIDEHLRQRAINKNVLRNITS